jgi:hypothetical protein
MSATSHGSSSHKRRRVDTRLGPDAPQTERLLDGKGRVVDDQYVAEAVAHALRKTDRDLRVAQPTGPRRAARP